MKKIELIGGGYALKDAPPKPEKRVKRRIWLEPLDDRVVVRPSLVHGQTAGGLIIPDTAREAPQTGVVLRVGPGGQCEDGRRLSMDVKQGDEVVFGYYSGTEIDLGDAAGVVVLLRKADLIAIIRGERTNDEQADSGTSEPAGASGEDLSVPGDSDERTSGLVVGGVHSASAQRPIATVDRNALAGSEDEHLQDREGS